MQVETATIIAHYVGGKIKRAKNVSKEDIISICTLNTIREVCDSVRGNKDADPKVRDRLYTRAYDAAWRAWKRKKKKAEVGYGFFVAVVNNFVLLANIRDARINQEKYMPVPSILLMHAVRKIQKGENRVAWREFTGVNTINKMGKKDWKNFLAAYAAAAKKEEGWLDICFRYMAMSSPYKRQK